jgi:hypothetical protein
MRQTSQHTGQCSVRRIRKRMVNSSLKNHLPQFVVVPGTSAAYFRKLHGLPTRQPSRSLGAVNRVNMARDVCRIV